MVTVGVTFVSIVIATFLGLIVALGRLSSRRTLRYPAVAFVEFMRGTPLILQLFFLYFVGPYIGISLDAIPAGIIGLSLNYSAYISEVFRSAIKAISKGQSEAATALGLSKILSFRLVIWPQALRIALPGLGNYFIAMFKDTALLSIITVQEIMFSAQQLASTTFQYTNTYIVAFAIYFLISYPASQLVLLMEHRLEAGHKR